jgi:hypothetical protein
MDVHGKQHSRKRHRVALLRRVAMMLSSPDDAKELRVIANEIEREVEQHNAIARNSYQRRKCMNA